MRTRHSPTIRLALAAVTAVASIAVAITVSAPAAATGPGITSTTKTIAKPKPSPPAKTTSVNSSAPSTTPPVDASGWPCLKVPVWDWDPVDGGAWVWITVVAPDAPPGTFCGAG